MTSLILPVASWLSSPFATACEISTVVSAEDGKTIVLGTNSGIVWTFRRNQAGQWQPKVMLCGHKSQVTAITLGKIEVEGVASGENIIFTASEDGEVIMWDLFDGRCLQANAEAFAGTITGVKMTTSGKYVICTGYSSNQSILDASSLHVVKTINPFSNWVVSLCLYPTENKYVDRVVAATVNGDIHVVAFDEQSLAFSPEARHKLEAHAVLPDAYMEINKYDRRFVMFVQQTYCSILMYTPERINQMTRIPALTGLRPWKGGRFLSSLTFLLWNTEEAYIFYLGDPNDFFTSSMGAIPSEAVVLFERDGLASFARKLGSVQANGVASTIANFSCAQDSTEKSNFSFCHYSHDGKHGMLAFGESGEIKEWHFQASLQAKQLKESRAVMSQQPSGAFRSCPDNETTLTDMWPLQQQPFDQEPTSVTCVNNRLVAFGFADGLIKVYPISRALQRRSDCDKQEIFRLQGHHGAVTTLYSPTSREAGGRNVILSGGIDCSVKIWNLDNGQLLSSFVDHAEPVRAFVPLPPVVASRLKASVVSIASDHSVALLDLEDLRRSYRLSGHSHQVKAIHWRLLDDILAVECIDDTVYIWQLKTGHLDRIVTGINAEDILGTCDGQVSCTDYTMAYRHANMRKNISAFPIFPAEGSPPSILVFQMNTKRIVNEITGVQSVTPPATPPTSAHPRNQPNHPLRTTSLYLEQQNGGNTRSQPPSPKLPAQNFSQNIMDIFKSRPSSPAAPSLPKSVDPVAKEETRDDITSDPVDQEVIRNLCSALLPWTLDENLDKICVDKLAMSAAGPNVAFGMRGANGYLSIFIPQRDEAVVWKVSPTVTAARLLNLMVLLRALQASKGEDVNAVINQFAASLPSMVGKEYAYPSFSFMAKYWQDPISEVQSVTRTLFAAAILNMTTDEKNSLVEYWRAHIPPISKRSSKMNMRAVLILGIFGCTQSDALNVRVCKDVAESLNLLIREEGRSVYRIAAIELLGVGFNLWEPHVNGTSVLRTLINYSGLAITPQNEAAQAGRTGSNTPSPAVIMSSRQALVQIATVNPALFISTLTFDLMHSKSAAERAGGLKLLGLFIAKKPIILYPHLGRIVEAIVKCLDPNQPQIRDALQQIVTVNFAELVKTYSNVAFHHASQRLGVGTTEGIAVVYDVRIAAKVQVLEGHTKAINALSFSPDGKLIATFSIEENTVRFWQPSGGFLGTLVGALTTGGATSGAAGVAALASVGGVGHMKSFRTFSLGPPPNVSTISPTMLLEGIKFEWTGERRVTINTLDGMQLAFTV
ncbi:hypothetical protein DFS34DRAFT_287308 [Phlyctochytrium arcticum]|nr:hypothetical protein DFS34DRAFT_287308 [Phlyctochytrium arcticum]